MLHVEVQNFQSVLDAAVDIDGYVALVGKSNIGKSAIVRALQCALTGAVGTDFVRHGPLCDRRLRQTKKCKCFSKVTVETAALKVVWEKGDTVNRYTVTREGATEVYEGLERGTPDFLQGAFSLVAVGEDKELIQVPKQFDPIFLLNQTGSVVANVMSDVARLDEVNAALTAVNKDRKDASSKRKVREEDVLRLRSELEAYAGLDEVAAEALGQAQTDLEATQARLARLERYIELARGYKETLLALRAALTVKLPDVDPLGPKAQQLDQVIQYEESFLALGPVIQSLESAVTGELPDVDPLVQAYAKAVEADEFVERLTVLAPILKKLKGVDAVKLPDDSKLSAAYESFLQAERFLGRLEAAKKGVESREKGFANLLDVHIDVDLEGLNQAVDLHDQAEASLKQAEAIFLKKTALEAVIAEQAEKLKTSEAEKQKFQDELQGMGMCPTCSQDIDAQHCLHLEAAS